MSLGIFVVGPSDKQVIPVLLRKLGQRAIHVRLAEQDEMLDAEAMLKHIDALKSLQRRLSRILIFLDSECTDPEKTRQRASVPEQEFERLGLRPPVNYIVVDHSLEGWLCSDIDAVRSVLGRGAQVHIRGNPENNCRPAQLLERIFRANDRDFRKTVHNLKIAEKANPSVITQRSPTFAHLVQALRHP